jgi:plasmid segregation protein ParM
MSESTNINLHVGNDNGNSEHDIVINDYLVAQPNVYAKVKELPMLDEVRPEAIMDKLEDNLIVTVNSPSAPPSIYYIGKYALKSGKRLHNMEVGLLNDKANSDIVIVNTLAQLACYAVKVAYKKNPLLDKQIVVNVDMTTALPVTQYSRSAADLLADKFMIKGAKHNVIVHVGTLRADVDIYFNFVKTLPESVPVVFYLQKAEGKIFEEFNKLYNLSVNGDYFKNKSMLHIAVGEGTTEYPITNDIVFNPEFIHGSDNGIGHAIENAMPDFINDIGLRTFTRQNYSAVLRDPGHKYYTKAMEHIEDPMEGEAEIILRNSKAEIEKANNDVDIICVHGGGSILMRPNLEPKLNSLCNKADIKLFYVPEEFAVTLEAKGMYEFTKSEIFKNLKIKNTDNEPLKITEADLL